MSMITTSYTSLGDFRKLQVKGNKIPYIYAFITTIETLAGTTRQAKVGMTVSPYEMRCYKRPISDEVAFLAIRIDCPAFSSLSNSGLSGKLLAQAQSNLIRDLYENTCHNALVSSGFSKDSENFAKDEFTMLEIKEILETTILG